jgi:hypothetical protein
MSLGSKPGRQRLALLVCAIAVAFAAAYLGPALSSGSLRPTMFSASPCKGLCQPGRYAGTP